MKYKRKPKTIEAFQFTGIDSVSPMIAEWGVDFAKAFEMASSDPNVMYILTLEGKMAAQVGWWIIKGIAGEFYPCANEIFEKSYEEDKS